jgi:hypothetical protein
VDKSYVGMRDSSKLLTGAKRKSHTARSLVAIAVEIQEPEGFGRIRLRRVPVDSETYLLPFVRDAVELGTNVYTGRVGCLSFLVRAWLRSPAQRALGVGRPSPRFHVRGP